MDAWGREGALVCTAPASPQASGTRTWYERGDLCEWYVETPRGLKQGFTVQRAAPGTGPLRVEIAVRGTLTVSVDAGGQHATLCTAGGACAVDLGELLVRDARGHALPAHMEGAAHQLRVVVDDANAVYPVEIDPLASSPAWMAEGNQVVANAGYSVASAGDVNGDGYADVLMGVPFRDGAAVGSGVVLVYMGSAAGLSITPARTLSVAQSYCWFGISVSSAGDVNHDGYDDVIVGAAAWDNGQDNEGAAFLYLGSANGLSASPSWQVESNQAGASMGIAVAGAGDVNGDGYADVLVGASRYSKVQSNEGGVYVYLGKASGLSTTSVAILESNQNDAHLGAAVASAGDVNGDGRADIIVGAPEYDNGQNDEGRVWVYLGTPTGISTTPVWSAESNQAGARMGNSVACAGDVNGDGYADVVVGAYLADQPNVDEGMAFVFLGHAGGVSPSAQWSMRGVQVGSNAGSSVAGAGDVDNDGFDDVIVGQWSWDNGQVNEGRALVYSGSRSGLGQDPSWTAESNQTGAWFGGAVASAGDVNGDGVADVLVGAPYYDAPDGDEGAAFLYLGIAPLVGDLDGDGVVNGTDLGLLLGAWENAGGAADLNRDGVVNGTDLGLLLGNWSV
ncbi:MAG: FG-GAP-like repeat-containing protein [Phycisphaerales bacterium]